MLKVRFWTLCGCQNAQPLQKDRCIVQKGPQKLLFFKNPSEQEKRLFLRGTSLLEFFLLSSFKEKIRTIRKALELCSGLFLMRFFLKVLHFILEQVLYKKFVCFFPERNCVLMQVKGGGRVSQLVLSKVRRGLERQATDQEPIHRPEGNGQTRKCLLTTVYNRTRHQTGLPAVTIAVQHLCR